MNYISENLSILETKRIKVRMNKPIYLGLSMLEIMYEFWYDYMKPKYDDKVKLCYINTDSLKQNISTKILLMMLKKGLILEIMRLIDHYQQERIKK